MIKAFVGSGGKTGTIMRQAAAYRAQGRRVLITTSTQMGAREGAILGDDPAPVIAALEGCGFVMAGQRARREGKMGALSEDTFREAAKHADVVLVEADGSRQHPLKFPNDTEPVIPEGTEEIVVICGLSAIGQRARDACHRLERVKAAIGIDDETVITAGHVQRLVCTAYLKPLTARFPQADIKLYPCQRDTLYLRAVAALLMADMDAEGIREEWFRGVRVSHGDAVTLEIVAAAQDGRGVGRIAVRAGGEGEKAAVHVEGGRTILTLPLERWEITQKK